MGRLTQQVATERRGGLLQGCLIVLVILIILGGIGAWYVASNWRGWAADGAKTVVQEVLKEASLPDEQKTAIMTEVNALANDFEAGKVSLQQMTYVFEEIAESPIIPATVIGVMQQEYVAPSELTTEEKADAKLALRRLARGVYEEKIEPERVAHITDPIAAQQGEQAAINFEIEGRRYTLARPEDVSTDELKDFLSRARAAADEAGIPPDPDEIDVAREVREAIGRGLTRTPGSAGGTPTAPAEDDQTSADPAETESGDPGTEPGDGGGNGSEAGSGGGGG